MLLTVRLGEQQYIVLSLGFKVNPTVCSLQIYTLSHVLHFESIHLGDTSLHGRGISLAVSQYW